MTVSDADVDRVARALAGSPRDAYTTPIVYPWAVQNFVRQPMAERPLPPSGPQRLYVHIPFCLYHCTFCFYAVRTGARRAEMERYVDALRRELEWVPASTPLSRLVVGGGTPTALPPDLFRTVLSTIFDRLPSAPDSGHTLEASPDSLTDEHIRALHDHKIGRVSIGVESMDDGILSAVQRRHTPDQALAACRKVTESGITLNADLIYGLPGQNEDSFRRDLEAVASTGVATLCLYALRLNERTAVAGQLTASERLDLGRIMRWRAFVKQAAADVGFVQTRSYTFKRASSEPSWHERSRTTFVNGTTTELGIGMAARAQLGSAVYRNHESIDAYMERVEQGLSPVESVFDLDVDDLKTQFVASVLANGRSLSRTVYKTNFQSTFDGDFGEPLERLQEGGLIEDDGEHVSLTELGRLVYDRVLLCFYPARARGWLADRKPVWRVRHA